MMITIPKKVSDIIQALERAGYEAYAVGGCVRDSLMKRAASDWDITTNALPEEVTKAFSGRRVLPTGVKHGTVSILMRGETFEITTYRIDGQYTDGRRPDNVVFTANLYEDLSRRDFTMNAMAYNPRTGLADPFGGVKDIESGIVRCVGEPSLRFGEDYLRMMRAYRFAAALNFTLAPGIRESVRELRGNIHNISAERIRVELDKLILSGNNEGFRTFMEDLGGVLFPEIAGRDDLPHIYEVFARARNDLSQKLCALFYKMGKAAAFGILKRLKYDNARIHAVTGVIESVTLPKVLERHEIKQMLREKGENLLRQVFTFLSACSDEADIEIINNNTAELNGIIQSGEPITLADLAVNGGDIGALLGQKSGKSIGVALDYLLNRVHREPELNTKDTLLNLLSQFIRNGRQEY